MRDTIEGVLALCREAGATILQHYGTEDARNKPDGSPLTAADLASHRILVEGLSALTPDIPVLSEESSGVSIAERQAWSRFWLVDPLDGTKEFIKRNGEFTVNVALIDGDQPVLGVVDAPALNERWWACDGEAWHQVGSALPQAIRVAGDPGGTPRIVVSRSHPSPDVRVFLDAIGDHECVAMGSSLKLCVVADGRAHLYPRLNPTMEWDTAAAHAVVLAAGGAVVTVDGAPLVYNKVNLLNPHFVADGTSQWNWRAALPGRAPRDLSRA